MFISQHDVARFRTGQLSDTMTNVQPLWMIESWLPAANWPGHICGWTWAVECHQASLSVKCEQYYIYIWYGYIYMCMYVYIYIYYMESIIGEWYDQLSAYNDTASTTNHSTVRCSLPCLVGQQISGSKCLCWTALEFWHWATDPWSPLSNVHQVQFNRIPPPLNIAGWIHRCQTCGGSGSSSPGRDTITCPVRLDEEVLLEMDILWSSHDHPMIILWSSYDHPMIILWSSYDHPMIILWSSYDPFAS